MKKGIIFIISAMLIGALHAQQQSFDVLKARSIFYLPAYNSLTNATAAGARPGNQVFIHSGADTGVYLRSWDNNRWLKVSGFGEGGATYTAGNGIKIEANQVRWADTIGTSTINATGNLIFNEAGDFTKVIALTNGQAPSYHANNVGSNVVIQDQQVSLYRRGYDGANISDNYRSSTLALYNNAFLLTARPQYNNTVPSSGLYAISGSLTTKSRLDILGDTVTLMGRSASGLVPYQPVTTSTTKYDVLLVDKVTQALVKISPANLISTQSWGLKGTAGTNPDSNFVGTIDNSDFVIRRNNLQVNRWLSNSSIYSGHLAGSGANGTDQTILHGFSSGLNSTGNTFATFVGPESGSSSINNSGAVYLGRYAGQLSENNTRAVVIGDYAGYLMRGSYEAVVTGRNAGVYADSAYRSIILGRDAGNRARHARYSFFAGTEAGRDADSTFEAIHIGWTAGRRAAKSDRSLFLGTGAGQDASNSKNLLAIGSAAGRGATDAGESLFIGYESGDSASGQTRAVFIGHSAGHLSDTGSSNIAIGSYVADGMRNTNNNIILGQKSGSTFSGNNIGSRNIIIGPHISLPNGTSNAFNLGAVLYGTGIHNGSPSNPSITASVDARIGIGVVAPNAVLDLRASTTSEATLNLKVSPAPTTPNDGDIWRQSNTASGLKIRIAGATYTVNLIAD